MSDANAVAAGAETAFELPPFGGTLECPIEPGPFVARVCLSNNRGYEVSVVGPRRPRGGTLDHHVTIGEYGRTDLESRKEQARIEAHRMNRAHRLGRESAGVVASIAGKNATGDIVMVSPLASETSESISQ